MNWLGKFSIARKLAILGLLGIVLVAVPTVFHAWDASRQIEMAKSDERAIAPSKMLLRIIQLTQQHLGLSAGYLSGNASFADARQAKAAEVDKAMEAMSVFVRRDISDAKIAKSCFSKCLPARSMSSSSLMKLPWTNSSSCFGHALSIVREPRF